MLKGAKGRYSRPTLLWQTVVGQHPPNNVSVFTDMAGTGKKSEGLFRQSIAWQTLLRFTILALAWLVGFSSRLFAVIRFESIIHEFDPW